MTTKRQITVILPYYENPLMLETQIRHFAYLPPPIRESIHLIVVDDGSQKFPVLPNTNTEIGLASFALYRILVDIRWNWIAARNLGMEHAPSEWALLTDIDHIVSESALEVAVNGNLDANAVYRFERCIAPQMVSYKPHANSWLLTKSMFSAIGGYDERFSGIYGSDGEFRKRVQRTARTVVILAAPLIVYTSAVVADAATTAYLRKQPQDRVGKARVRRLIQESPQPHRLMFPWCRII